MVIQLEAKTLGDRVRVTRVSKHFSQKVLSLIAHVAQITVSRIERNSTHVSDEERQKVLKALEID